LHDYTLFLAVVLAIAGCSATTSEDQTAPPPKASDPAAAQSADGSQKTSAHQPTKPSPGAAGVPQSEQTADQSRPAPVPNNGQPGTPGSAAAPTITPEQIQRWLTNWAGDDASRRTEAGQHLAQAGDLALEQIAHVLDHGAPELRWAAASYLVGRVGARNKAAVAALAHCLTDNDAALRHLALQAIQGLPEATLRGIVPQLVVQIANPDEDEIYRVRAIRLLGRLGTAARAAIDTLEKIVRSDSNPRVRRAALAAITKGAEPKQAEPFFVEILRSSDAIELRRSVPMWLSRVASTDDTVHALISAFDDPDEPLRRQVNEALVAIGKPAVPALIETLGASDSVQQRRYAIYTLGKLGPLAAAAVPTLKKLRHDPNTAIANLATAALKLIER